ncbi:MAG: hypothetical protein OMM_06384 [Candidatus Magnetoglobus multicellularis str. Araruama]|uniref:Uncharacterized protein n=1 Tax=Candidatus Magnetoglobus multicellularis str. Araruama TaxID=890399 RepID=A0A1V1PI01_9BACT|nr:MAG: hypothetical protein OMM_06384 [Candidatus Magnetoglobus multicellularis str. Araruama]
MPGTLEKKSLPHQGLHGPQQKPEQNQPDFPDRQFPNYRLLSGVDQYVQKHPLLMLYFLGQITFYPEHPNRLHGHQLLPYASLEW